MQLRVDDLLGIMSWSGLTLLRQTIPSHRRTPVCPIHFQVRQSLVMEPFSLEQWMESCTHCEMPMGMATWNHLKSRLLISEMAFKDLRQLHQSFFWWLLAMVYMLSHLRLARTLRQQFAARQHIWYGCFAASVPPRHFCWLPWRSDCACADRYAPLTKMLQ
jgi:hypothetical protein